MSYITIDHAANIDRIIAILKAGASIFDGLSNTALIRKIFFAETNYDMEDDTTPYIYVQIADNFQFTREPYGTQLADFEQMLAAYNVIIVSQKKDAVTVQRDLFNWTNLIVQQLKHFPQLDNPSVPGTDKKAVRTNIISLGRRFSQKGTEKQGAIIQIQIQSGSAWQLSLPGGILLDLLSKPLDRNNIDEDTDLFDDASFTVTKKAGPRSISCEYENTASLETSVNSLMDGLEKSITLVHQGVSRTYVGVLISIDAPIPFDNLERRIVNFKVIQ